MSPDHLGTRIVIVPYNPRWPDFYTAERQAILDATGPTFLAIEHIGSTAIPDLTAKPIIDIMASVADLASAYAQGENLAVIGYVDEHTDMPNRILYNKRVPESGFSVHFHVVTADTWETRNERLMRDYLLRNPEVAQAYGELKQRLAVEYGEDRAGYTRAKTSFIQEVIDRARADLGLPPVDVWEAS